MSTEPNFPDTERRPQVDAAFRARQVEVEDIKWQMSSKPGRRVMRRLIAESGMYQDSFTGSSATFYKDGKRALGLVFLNDIASICPNEYVLMLTEGKAA